MNPRSTRKRYVLLSQVSYLMASYHIPNVLIRYSDTAVFGLLYVHRIYSHIHLTLSPGLLSIPLDLGMVLSLVGGLIGQSGEWNVAMAAQRQADYGLNYAFTSKIANAPHQASNTNMKMDSSGSNGNISNSQNQEEMPKFDLFALLAIILSHSWDY
jgi:hypothetical protein